MLHETICNDDFHRNIAFQYWNNVATMSQQRCNAVLRKKSLLRIVTSPLVTYHSMFDIYLRSRGARGHAVVMVNDPFSDLPFFW